MNTDSLNELLASIDEPASPPDDAKARVWERIQHDLDPIHQQPPTPSINDDTVLTIQPMIEDESTPRWHRIALVAAAVSLLVAGAILFESQDQPVEVATDLTPASEPTSLPTLSNPTAACERFVLGTGPLLDLEDSVGTTAEETAKLEAAAAGLDQLLIDFGADSQSEPSTLSDIAQIAGGLRQAADHLANGDQSQARDAFDFVKRTYADSALTDIDCLD